MTDKEFENIQEIKEYVDSRKLKVRQKCAVS